jgi:hypothetical protein
MVIVETNIAAKPQKTTGTCAVQALLHRDFNICGKTAARTQEQAGGNEPRTYLTYHSRHRRDKTGKRPLPR